MKRRCFVDFLRPDNRLILEAEEASGGSGGGRRWMSVASLERVLARDDENEDLS